VLPSRFRTYVLVKEGRVPFAIHRNLVRDAEAIPVDLWSHVKDIRGMLSRAKVRVVVSVRAGASCPYVLTPPLTPPPPPPLRPCATMQVWSEKVRRQFLQASTQRPARRVDPSTRKCLPRYGTCKSACLILALVLVQHPPHPHLAGVPQASQRDTSTWTRSLSYGTLWSCLRRRSDWVCLPLSKR
jgi:hypothetical protein